MKAYLLVMFASICAFSNISGMQPYQEKKLSVKENNDFKAFVLKKLIVVDRYSHQTDLKDFVTTVGNIIGYALANVRFKAFIDDPENMIWLVELLSKKFYGKKEIQKGEIFPIDELYIAKAFSALPGVNNQKFYEWLMHVSKEKELFDAVYHKDIEKIKKLLTAGVDVNSVDVLGKTPLHALIAGTYKAEKISLDILKLLLERHANVNAQDNSGDTPLTLAVLFQLPEFVEEILKYNPDLTIAMPGRAAWDYAAKFKDKKIFNMLRGYNVQLLEKFTTELQHAPAAKRIRR